MVKGKAVTEGFALEMTAEKDCIEKVGLSNNANRVAYIEE